jgi:hypothetical protein
MAPFLEGEFLAWSIEPTSFHPTRLCTLYVVISATHSLLPKLMLKGSLPAPSLVGNLVFPSSLRFPSKWTEFWEVSELWGGEKEGGGRGEGKRGGN